MYLISNSIKDLGLIPVYERDTKPKDVKASPQVHQSVAKLSNKPQTPPDASRKDEELCHIIDPTSTLTETSSKAVVDELQLAKI